MTIDIKHTCGQCEFFDDPTCNKGVKIPDIAGPDNLVGDCNLYNPKPIAASIEIKGDYEVIYRCGACESLNIGEDFIDEKNNITCPDCGIVNLIPAVTECECEDCQVKYQRAKF